MRTLARFALLLAVVAVALTAFQRMYDAGVGCPDWPACYGRIGSAAAADAQAAETAADGQAIGPFTEPLPLAGRLHHLALSALGLASLALVIQAFRARHQRLPMLATFGFAAVLLSLDAAPVNAGNRAVFMANLAGGFALVALLGWRVFSLTRGAPRYTETHIRNVRPLAITAMTLLILQILLGGLTSANFAATACPELLDCQGGWMPDATIYAALRVDRPLNVSATGVVLGGLEHIAIHRAHRVFAVLVTASVLATAIAASKSIGAMRPMAGFMLLVLAAQLGTGIAGVVVDVPIGLALAHHLLALLLLLALLKLLALTREGYLPPA